MLITILEIIEQVLFPIFYKWGTESGGIKYLLKNQWLVKDIVRTWNPFFLRKNLYLLFIFKAVELFLYIKLSPKSNI